MTYIILSDIHGNLQAFESVISSFPKTDNSRIVCAGDVVGYGADPNECIELIMSLGAENVLGNHDAAVIDKTDISYFNENARKAVLWTRERLDRAGRDYLNGLPLVRENPSFTVVHGTLHDPAEFIYMQSGTEAMRTFEILNTKICFVGHSHVPGVFVYRDSGLYQSFERKISLEDGARYIVNVGSVGQPRDNDNRACYCVYDSSSGEIEFHRIKYDVISARERIISAGLPGALGDRLLFGR
ncbi:MAG: metallophosphoesterase [Candidatus Makaraimicrobium thalassicum]|nr:MAG: metallophosphoesterase [Candidatus Omnitrophota bacterium]